MPPVEVQMAASFFSGYIVASIRCWLRRRRERKFPKYITTADQWQRGVSTRA